MVRRGAASWCHLAARAAESCSAVGVEVLGFKVVPFWSGAEAGWLIGGQDEVRLDCQRVPDVAFGDVQDAKNDC